MADTANNIWRDFVTDGLPSSGANKPAKAAIREWGTAMESIIAAGTLSDAVWKTTKAILDADLAHAADTIGVVYDDSTAANNGLYKKSGASGSGSWAQLTTFLPGYQFVTATDSGSSTANAMTMNTSPRLPAGDGVALVLGFVPVTNTSSTVTISFDGGTALAVKTGSNNNPAVGGLVAGMPIAGVVSGAGTTFRLLSDQASAAIVADAEAARDQAVAAASSVTAPKANIAAVQSDTPSSNPGWYETAGYTTAGDGGGALYRQVGSEPAHAGKVQNGNGIWYEIAETVVNPIMFGAAGDGATNDQSSFQAAIDYPSAITIDGLGLTYRVDSTLTLRANLTLENATFDFSNAATADKLFEGSGVLGAALTLSSNATAGTSTVDLSSAAGLAAGDYIWISSSFVWAAIDGTTLGEMAQIKSIAGATLTLTAPLAYTYTTAASATVQRFEFLRDLRLERVNAFGSGVGGQQYGMDINLAQDVRVIDCVFEDFDDRAIQIARSAHVEIRGTRANRAFRAGLAYGVAIINGCHWVNITGCSFERVRHGVTVGGQSGINRYITVDACCAFGVFEAGFDAHVASDIVKFTNNNVQCDTSVTVDGIIVQGANATITGNTVRGANRYGIFHQVLVDFGTCTSVVANNDCEAGGTYGVFVGTYGTALLESVVISANTTRNYAGGFRLRAGTASVNSYSISGNSYYEPTNGTSQGIYVEAPSTFTCHDGSIVGNSGRIAAGGTGILLNAASANFIQYVTVTGNSFRGGDYGLRGLNTNRIAAVGNSFSGATTPIAVAGAITAIANNITT